MKMITFGTAMGLAILGAFPLFAAEVPPVSFNLGGGFVQGMRSTGRSTDIGWNAQAGVGFNFNPVVGAMLDFNYNSLGINSATLNALGVPGGTLSMFSFTLDPVIHLNPHRGPADVYIIGGGGVYHRTETLTAPSVVTFTGFDPFFGFFPYQAVTNQVVASDSVTKPGANIGMGVSFGTKWRAKFYAEARYHRMFNGNSHTDMLPVSFGVRF